MYCGNDPVNYSDKSGHSPDSIWKTLLGIAVGVGLAVVTVAAVVASEGTLLVSVLVGAGAMIIGANEIVDGITGTNYIQEWTGWSDDLYNGLYIGSNIISSVGTIAGNIYMKYNPPYPERNPNKIPDGFNNRVNDKANYYNPKTGHVKL